MEAHCWRRKMEQETVHAKEPLDDLLCFLAAAKDAVERRSAQNKHFMQLRRALAAKQKQLAACASPSSDTAAGGDTAGGGGGQAGGAGREGALQGKVASRAEEVEAARLALAAATRECGRECDWFCALLRADLRAVFEQLVDIQVRVRGRCSGRGV